MHTAVGKTGVSSGKSVGRNDRLWHLKNSDLSNAVSQSPRIPLWHLKSRYLPNAVSKSPRIPLWHLKNPNLPKAVSQSPRIPLWHLKSRYLPNASSQSPEFSGAEFANQTAGSIGGKTFQSENRQTIPRIRLRRILELLHRDVGKTGNRRTVPEFGFAEFLSFGTRRLHKA